MPRLLDKHKNIKISTAPNLPDVKPVEQIKILGYLFNARGDIVSQVNSLVSSTSALFHLASLHSSSMNYATRRNFVFAHIVSRLNYIMPFVPGHPIKVKKKVTAIWVRAAKFIYGQDTRGLMHDELFTKVNFPLKSNIYKASWLHGCKK